jgi:hypothetical protein
MILSDCVMTYYHIEIIIKKFVIWYHKLKPIITL